MWRGLLGSNDGPAQAAIYIQDRMRLLCATVSALATMMDWIQHRHFGAMPASIIEVALAQANAPARVVDALWGGDDSLLQAVLLRTHHPDQVWPSSMLGKRALAALRKRVPVALASLIDASGPDAEHGIFWPLIDDRKAAVVNIPVLMGIWAMTGIGMNWWNRSGRLCQVAEICAFDRVWFNTAYNQGTKIALAYGVQSQHGGDL